METTSHDLPPPPPKRTLTANACNRCRAKKVKCDGVMPTCSGCAKRHITCTYRPEGHETALKRKYSELQESFHELHWFRETLQNAPEHVALAMFKELRRGTSVSDVAKTMPTHPVVTGSLAAAAGLNEPFSLSNRHPRVFSTSVPLDIVHLDLRLLGLGDSPPPGPSNPCLEWPSLTNDSLAPGSHSYGDIRLEDIHFQQWTLINIPNSLAARAISFYLVNEHPLLALFDADLFIGDLRQGRERFCSRLLVNALLSWAFATYTQFGQKAREFSQAFLDEAETYWEKDRLHGTLPTLSAAILLTLTWNHYGNDRKGLLYLDESAEMGRQMQLFGVEESSSLLGDGDETYHAAASFTAWGVFGWHTLHSIFFRRKHSIHHPPWLPIPGDATVSNFMNRPSPHLPHYMGNTFTWISKFWLIVHKIFKDGYDGFHRSAPLRASAAYQELLAWSNELPANMGREEDSTCPHHVLILHIWFHAVVLDIWRPLLGSVQPLTGQAIIPATAAYYASVHQLKYLVLLYRKRYEAVQQTMLATPGYLSLLNEVFRRSREPDAQHYFLLGIHGCLSMAPWCPGLSGIAKAFLYLGWRNGVFRENGWSLNVVSEIMKTTSVLDKDTQYSSLYPIDLAIPSDEDAKTGNMEILAKEFQQIALHDEKAGNAPVDTSASHTIAVSWKGNPQDLNLTLSEEPKYHVEI